MIEKTKYFIEQKFRSSPLPIKGLPIGLRSVGQFYVPKGQISPTRYSTYVVMAWALDGDLKVIIEDIGNLVLSPGKLIIIGSGLSYDLEVISEEANFRYIAIDGHNIDETILSMGLWTGLFPCREVPNGWLNALSEIVTSDVREKQVLATSRAHDLFVFQANLVKELYLDNLIYQSQWYFHRNYHDTNINVDAAVSYLQIDRATLSKRFKKYLKCTPLEYLTRIRISCARRILKNTNTPVHKVALESGYKDPSYFARLFKKRTGLTPLEYRLNNYRNESANLSPEPALAMYQKDVANSKSY